MLLLLAFDCYLRPCDVNRLQKGNYVAPQNVAGAAKGWTLVLNPLEGKVPSKNGSFDDSLLVGHGRRRWLNRVVGSFLRPRADASPLLGFDDRKTRRLIAHFSKKLELGPLHLSFHGLRHGGPSTDFLEGTLSIEDIQRRGRWKSLSSVRRYEKHGRLSAQLSRLTDSQKRVASLASVALPGRLLRAFG